MPVRLRCTVLAVVLAALVGGGIVTNATFIKTWHFLGPFPVGKTEYDGDPVEALGGIGTLTVGDPDFLAFSELVEGGKARWTKLKSSRDGVVTLAPQVDWSRIIHSLNSITALEFQGWVVGSLEVKASGLYSVMCKGVHTFEVVPKGKSSYASPKLRPHYHGDIYTRGEIETPLRLEHGRYWLRFRQRAKQGTRFACAIRKVKPGVAIANVSPVPDFVDGHAAGDVLGLTLMNRAGTWADAQITVKVVRQDAQSSAALDDTSMRSRLAPGQTKRVAALLRWKQVDVPAKEIEDCVTLQVTVQAFGRATSATVSLRCRHIRQSFLVTYRDFDGTPVEAAAIAPSTRCPTSGCWLLLSLSGVGVSPGGQADAHKFKATGDEDFRFGLPDAWILAPERPGAHNWEGVGHQTAKYAIFAFKALVEQWVGSRPLRVDRVLFDGHSRGGHGSLLMATHLPDAVAGIVSAGGWFRREYYGDANPIFNHDVQLDFLDPARKAILERSIAEHDCAPAAVNLRGRHVHLRSGGHDMTVPVWMSRRYARVLQVRQPHAIYAWLGCVSVCACTDLFVSFVCFFWSFLCLLSAWLDDRGEAALREQSAMLWMSGVHVDYTEHPGLQHWWWDTETTNDGGVIFDDHIRTFWTNVTRAFTTPHDVCQGSDPGEEFVVYSYNPATFGSVNGLRILRSQVAASASLLRVRRMDTDATAAPVWTITSDNVDRFALISGFCPWKTIFAPGEASVSVDGVVFSPSVQAQDVLVFERQHDTWVLGRSGDSPTRRTPQQRTLAQNGPMRQVFSRPVVVVQGTQTNQQQHGDSEAMLQAISATSIFIANSHVIASGTAMDIVNDTDVLADPSMVAGKNLVIVGSPTNNAVAEALVATSPVHLRFAESTSRNPRGFVFDAKHFNDSGDAIVTVVPGVCVKEGCRHREGWQPEDVLAGQHLTPELRHQYALDTLLASEAESLALLVAGNSPQSLMDLTYQSFASSQALTRAVFTNMLPDAMVTNRDFRKFALSRGVHELSFYHGMRWDTQAAPCCTHQ